MTNETNSPIAQAFNQIVAENPGCPPGELRQICFTTATRMSAFAERVQRQFWALVDEAEFAEMQRMGAEADEAWLASEYDDELPADRLCPECGLAETLDPLGGMSCRNGCCYG